MSELNVEEERQGEWQELIAIRETKNEREGSYRPKQRGERNTREKVESTKGSESGERRRKEKASSRTVRVSVSRSSLRWSRTSRWGMRGLRVVGVAVLRLRRVLLVGIVLSEGKKTREQLVRVASNSTLKKEKTRLTLSISGNLPPTPLSS